MRIQIENLSFRYKSFGAPAALALNNINLDINEGEFLAIVGPSGSGKTTLIQHLTGLLKPDTGRVLIDGTDLWAKTTSHTEIRRRIGLVFQFPETQLFEDSVYDDVAFGPRQLGLSEDEIHRRIIHALAAVELDFDQYKDRSPINLSEGEKRRVAIAGVLAIEPEVLVLDEPTAGLDAPGLRAVVNILQRYHEQAKTILIVTHNLELVAALAQRVVLVSEGRIEFDGPKAELFQNGHLLESTGLGLPRLFQIIRSLQQKGWLDSDEVYSIQGIKQSLSKNL
jgi:energy-coupling factor transport system ATP-binding protein